MRPGKQLSTLAIIALITIAASTMALAQPPNHLWSRGFGVIDFNQVNAVVIDGSGNTLITGFFAGSVDLGGGPVVANGTLDIFVAKYDPNGNHLWSRHFGTAELDAEGDDIAVDGSGNVFVIGAFEGAIDFDGNVLAGQGLQDVFLAKFDANGTHLWSRSFGGTDDDVADGVTTDASGDVLITGGFQQTADFGGGPLVSAGFEDVYVAKYTGAGAHVWSMRAGEAGTDRGTDLDVVEADGSVFVTGMFSGTVDFGGGDITGPGSIDWFIAKYNTSGAHVWSNGYGSLGAEQSYGVAAGASGNVVVAGRFEQTMDLGGSPLVSVGGRDIFVVGFDITGAHSWSHSAGAIGPPDVARSVALDDAGNAWVTGQVSGTVDFGGGPITSAGGTDIFMVSFDAAGVHTSSRIFGSTATDAGRAIATAGNLVALGGTSRGLIDLGGGPLDSGGNVAGFVGVFGTPPNPPSFAMDIMPGSCSNPLNITPYVKNKGNGKTPNGVLPVAVLGADGYDVHDIDVSTLMLEGVAPLRSNYSDVGTPATSGEDCACAASSADGLTDLTLKFLRADLIAAMGAVTDADEVKLTLTGMLTDGTWFEASDCVLIKNNVGKPNIMTPFPGVVLLPPSPNPFNPSTRIAYVLGESGHVKLSVYDVGGRLVTTLREGFAEAGQHELAWNAGATPSGVYYVRITFGGESAIQKLVLLK